MFNSATDVQLYFKDSQFIKRTIESHKNDLRLSVILELPQNGVKIDNCFNELLYFNIIDGFPPDLMHDFLEGVLVYNFGFMMNHLNDKNILNFELFEKELNEFKYSRLEKKNTIPKGIFTKFSYKTPKGFHLSATHFWTLIRIFPLMLGEMLQLNENFLHFLDLCEIFFLLNDSSYDYIQLEIIETKIESYLSKFVKLYTSDQLCAKFHFIIHYPRLIRTFGPLKQASTMRFESKHSQIKRQDHAIHNHINSTKSITVKHQEMQLYYLLSPDYYHSWCDGPLDNSDLNNQAIISSLLIDKCSINFHKWLIFKNIKYYLGDMICYANNTGSPQFGQIKYLIKQNSELIFFLNKFKTIKYYNFLRAFQVSEELNSVDEIINSKNIKNLFPIDLYKVKNYNHSFVSLKYPLIK